MSQDIGQDEHQEPQEELDANHSNSVPIINDKEIEAIFVGGVPAEADEGILQLSTSLSTKQLPEIRGNQVCQDYKQH